MPQESIKQHIFMLLQNTFMTVKSAIYWQSLKLIYNIKDLNFKEFIISDFTYNTFIEKSAISYLIS